jgi:hypothetical protein
LKDDPTLAEEIKARCGATHLDKLPLDLPEGPADSVLESNLDDDDNQDDSDVPLGEIVRDALGAGLDAPSTSLPVSAAAQDIEGTGMCATNDEEDIWAFDDQGRKWVDIGAPADDDSEDGAESSQNA